MPGVQFYCTCQTDEVLVFKGHPRMHIAFIDIACGYAADRPDQDQSLGGTTSAVCFLAHELVKAGARCTFFNKIRAPQMAYGIHSLPLENLADECANNDYDVFVF